MNGVLVDSSVWIDHFRGGNERLRTMLEGAEVVTHPFVVGELACGSLRNRRQTLDLLSALPSIEMVGHDEVMHVLDARRLFGLGLGWVDVHLLAASLLFGTRLYTLDRALRSAAESAGVSE